MLLSKRLSCIAALIDDQAQTLIDIGYDHGHLLHWAAQQEFQCIVGIEVTDHFADRYRTLYGDDVELRTGDGLGPIKDFDKSDCVVIAGLGEERIRQILDAGKALLENIDQIIVCPSSRDFKLHAFMRTQGWYADQEELIDENQRLYCVSSFRTGRESCADETILSIAPRIYECDREQFDIYKQQLQERRLI